ncbi:MAG: DUF411 domain-containing protein [Burkholderiales bacterium]|nr:DUF411 domain-containing protein [Burkholderiales bacterium]
MNRRKLLQTSVALAAATLGGLGLAAQPPRPMVEVWKTANCGCCKDWIKHLQASGFDVKTNDVSNDRKNEVRQRLGLAEKFGSCHTALVNGYVLEGHVPAREIQRLLKDQPVAVGLAVPGMPVGSPGMDGPEYGGLKDPYDVLLVQRGGTARVFQSYR